MRKRRTEQQIKNDAVNDVRAARHLIETGSTAQELTVEFKWSQRRARKCIENYRAEQVVVALQGLAKRLPEITDRQPEWTHPASYYFQEVQLNLLSDVVNSIIVTEATTAVSEPFFNNLAAFSNFRSASLIAGARPNLRSKIDQFPEYIRDYVVFDRVRVNDDLLIITDPGKARSASDPLTDLLKANGGKHVVVCHPRIAMQSIARHNADLPAYAWSSGSISPPDFDQSTAAGQDAFRAAQLQALLIEIDVDGTVFFHQLKAEQDGSFQFLDHYVTGGAVYHGAAAEVLHAGDGHTDVMSPPIADVSFGWDAITKQPTGRPSLLERLKPRYLYLDDVLNFSYRNKFSMTATELTRQYHLGQGSVRQELVETATFINSCMRDSMIIRKVEDNHGMRFVEWMEGDRRKDPIPDNSMFWAEMLVAKHRMLRDDPENFRSAHLEHEALLVCGMSDAVEFIYRGTSSKVDGVEHGIHFHRGINGSPGRASHYKALGYPVVGGHPHSPSIDDGVVTVGTCSDLREGWDPDATTKAHGHAIQYPNGHVVLCLLHPDGRYEPAGARMAVEQAA